MLVRCRGRAVLAVTEHVRTRMPDAVAAMFGVSGNACGAGFCRHTRRQRSEMDCTSGPCGVPSTAGGRRATGQSGDE